jgi:hypothetical protein
MIADVPSSTVTWCQVTVYGAEGSVLEQWSIRGTGAPDLGVVDRVARLRLEAIRTGTDVALSNVCPDLAQLLHLVGLNPLAP